MRKDSGSLNEEINGPKEVKQISYLRFTQLMLTPNQKHGFDLCSNPISYSSHPMVPAKEIAVWCE